MKIEVWSRNYQKSKENFNITLKSLESKGINISHSELNIDELDPYGQNLYIDVAWIGNPRAEKLYMSTSGIHGVEGFAGSAIQLSVLNNFNKIPDNVAFAFIHILNPWGMSWIRRENESNVDLNRNFLDVNEKYKGSHPHYVKLDPIINIKTQPTKFDFFNIRMMLHAMIHGKTKTKQAYAEGQYDFPNGLHFGGHQLEKGPTNFLNWLKTHLVNVKKCVWIDLHTGLGESGEDSLLVDLSPEHKKFTKLRNQSFGQRIMSLDPKAGVAYKIRGGMQKGVELRFPNIDWTSITQEFGTIPSVEVIKSLRAENGWTHYNNLKGQEILNHWSKKAVLDAFRPQDKEWEKKIIYRGNKLFNQTLEYLLN